MKGIPLKTWEVQAILDGRKTVTRRVMKLPRCGYFEHNPPLGVVPPYRIGDIIYVREAWFYETFYESSDNAPDLSSGNRSWRYVYKADNPDYPVIPGHWSSPINMPREAARIFLRVTDVRVEQLNDITISGLQDEGILPDGYVSQFAACTADIFDEFKELWDNNIKPADRSFYGWDANPWVFVISFEMRMK